MQLKQNEILASNIFMNNLNHMSQLNLELLRFQYFIAFFV